VNVMFQSLRQFSVFHAEWRGRVKTSSPRRAELRQEVPPSWLIRWWRIALRASALDATCYAGGMP